MLGPGKPNLYFNGDMSDVFFKQPEWSQQDRRHHRHVATHRFVSYPPPRFNARLRYPRPEAMVERIADGPLDIRSVIKRAMNHPQFGPWIAFKVADMLDAVQRA